MGEVVERQQIVEQIFKEYDCHNQKELTALQVQMIHQEMRIGGISYPQVEASIKYVCALDTVDKSELVELLQEMDRRYYLIQDLRWEFSMLDHNLTDTITEDQAKWLMQAVHGKYFLRRKWEKFLRTRAVPGSGVCFAEIEVELCNIPSKVDLLHDEDADRREQEERERKLRELENARQLEKERLRKKREEERKKKEEEEKKRKKEEAKRRKEEEDERKQRQREKEEMEKKKRELEEEEERGRQEAEEREKREKEEEEKRLKKLLEEEEEKKKREAEEAKNAEKILEEAAKDEKEAEEEAKKAQEAIQKAKDDKSLRDAQEAEKKAKIRERESRNKRIRYNLKVAVKNRDRKRLKPAMDDFKKAKLPDDDMDLAKAERLLKEFQARDGLKKAMTARQLKELERAIAFVKNNGFEGHLAPEMIEANKMLLQLRRLERIRAEILELKQSTVAEIRSYQKPPPAVHTVMTATFLLLGHKEKETQDWKTVQALVGKTGKEGLKRRCLECEPGKLKEDATKRSKALFEKYELDEVRDVSAGAATFYLWGTTMIEEFEAQQAALKAQAEEKAAQKAEAELTSDLPST